MGYDFERGSSQFLHYGDILDGIITGADVQFTMACTVTFESLPSATMSLISKSADSAVSEDNRQVVFRVNPNNRFDLIFYGQLTTGGNFQAIEVTTALSTGVLYRAVVTYDGTHDASASGRVAIYINSTTPGTNNVAVSGGSFPFDTLSTGTAKLSVGASVGNGGTGSYFLDANQMANVGIWSKILSTGEIGAYMKGYAPDAIGSALHALEWAPPLVRLTHDPITGTAATASASAPTLVDHVATFFATAPATPPAEAVAAAATYTRYRRPEGLATDMNGGTDRLLVWDNSLTVPRLKRAEILAADSGAPTLPNMPTGYAQTGASWVKIEGSDGVVGAVPIWPPS